MPGSAGEPSLNYAGPATRRAPSLHKPLYAALVCGLAPAVLGTLIIAGWLVTQSHVFELLGLVNIFVGLSCTLVGGIALITHFWRSIATGRRPVRSWLGPGVVAAVILIGNFPLCGFYFWVSTLYSVRVVNATGATVSSFVVHDPAGQTWELGPIRPGGSSRRMLGLKGEGTVTFTATVGGSNVGGELEGYITSGMTNGRRTVTLNADGSVSVR
jgi:hypothetical protein